MTNPTRLDIIRAHQTLNDLRIFLNARGELESDTIKYTMRVIEKALPPKPQPTMADVEWDDELHYLAEAEHPEYGKVIMIGKSTTNGDISCGFRAGKQLMVDSCFSSDLTLTGRRYTLTEVQE